VQLSQTEGKTSALHISKDLFSSQRHHFFCNPALGEEQTNPLVRMHVAAATNSTREALDVRNSFIECFILDEGRVEWQNRVVNRVN